MLPQFHVSTQNFYFLTEQMILSKRPVKQAVFLNAHFYESIISANLFIDFYLYNCLLALKFILTCL